MKTIQTTQINLHDCKKIKDLGKDRANYFLEKLVDFIGMRKIPEKMIGSPNPNSFEFIPEEVGLPDVEYGVTGCILMYESHCSLHAWNNTGFVAITICSCKEYDQYIAAKFCSLFFDSKNYDIY
jgi:S-adenosylmethionine/arginine decarboxylase-like enzyme